MFQRIGNTLSVATDNRGGLVRVDIPEVANYQPYTQGPDPRVWEGSWRSVTDPNQVAKYICEENARQYNQAENTPFGSGYLAEKIGMSASTQSAEDVLQGTFLIPDSEPLLPETREILNELGKPLTIQPCTVKVCISSEEFKSTYKIVKEATASSPSGRHVGHYKAAATND